MASVEQLKMTHGVDVKVMGVDDKVEGVAGQVQDVRSDVQDVGDKVQTVEDRVQDVRSDVRDVDYRVQGIESNVQGLDDKLEQANRSLSYTSFIVIPQVPTTSQVTSSEIASYDGFRPQTHPPIITLHSNPITTAQLDGFSKELYSITGNLLVHSCGYTENVCHS
jgi:uncharacterized protein YoxC